YRYRGHHLRPGRARTILGQSHAVGTATVVPQTNAYAAPRATRSRIPPDPGGALAPQFGTAGGPLSRSVRVLQGRGRRPRAGAFLQPQDALAAAALPASLADDRGVAVPRHRAGRSACRAGDDWARRGDRRRLPRC